MHTDPELLGLLALGENEGSADDRGHALTCPQCADELSQLRRLVTMGRSVGVETTLDYPSPDIWVRIRDELNFDLTLEPPAVARSVSATTIAGSEAEPVRRSLLATIKAALAGFSSGSEGELTAHARLTPVEPSWSAASGTAELATDEQGRRLLQVALHADLPTSGVRQAWLVHRDDPNVRQALGMLDGHHGLWTVEHSIDLSQYAILEISQQGTGETEHSGQTIVRGELTLAS